MTTLNPQASSLPSPSGSTRARLVLSAALAVAALGVGGTATGVLVTGSVGGATAATAAPATAAPDPAGPAAPLPAPAPAAPAAPVAPVPGLATVDSRGTALPAVAERGARTVFSALESGDSAALASLRGSYAPTAGGASWSAVQRVLADPSDRAGLLDAMRSAPQTGAGVPYLYSRDGFRLGLDDAGRIRFVRAP